MMAVVGLALFLLLGLRSSTTGEEAEMATEPLLYFFGAGALAICAMILPGISGSFLLLILGMYEPTLDAVHERDVAYLAVFLAGAVIGISVFAMLLRWLLEHAHDLTMAALVGLMIGSLRALWPFLEDDRSLRMPADGDPVMLAIALGLGGLIFVLALTRLGDAVEASDAAVDEVAARR